MATRKRKATATPTTTPVTGEESYKMATERGSLTKLQMIEVTDEELAAASGGRGHGAYDEFVEQFIEENIRGTGVDFEGVAAQSVKTGLKGAIARAVEQNKVKKDELQIRGKDGRVYLVRPALETAEA